MDIILYLLTIIQYLYQMNCWLLNFICRYIPLKQWAFDDSHSPKYQKYKIDELPLGAGTQDGKLDHPASVVLKTLHGENIVSFQLTG